MDVSAIQLELQRFADERDWEQFHTPKNLATALMCEAAELAEIFQWLTPAESIAARTNPSLLESLEEEIADVQIYLLRLTSILGIDLETAVKAKIKKNAVKYPVEKSKGNAIKYNKREE